MPHQVGGCSSGFHGSSLPGVGYPGEPTLAGVRSRLGKAQEAAMDLTIGRQLNPGIDRDYGQFGVKPSDLARALGNER